MTGILPLVGVQLFDKDASPVAFLSGGLVDIYLPTTTTPAAIFSDFGLTTPLANPFTLNTAGRFPAVYVADGAYRIRVKNSASVLQFDDDEVAAVTAAISSTPIVVTAEQLWATGHLLVRYDDQPYAGFVRANGRTVGSATSGATERANVDCQPLFNLLWTFANITLTGGAKGASAAADWAANRQLVLPDMAGRLIGARDDLGDGAKSRITAATVTGPTVVGAVGGAQTVTLDATMIPSHTHTFAGSALAGHTHTYTDPTSGAGQNAAGAIGTSQNSPTANAGTTGSTSAGTPAGTNSNTGGGLAHSNMPPVMLFTIYFKL